ncbi:hypothetical protein BS50DRAFT_156352 [Corynespora cassiicola Philippines]|uniref:Uncharacterized protein n=1 Tax=Corynespora cassiicola Philippines TaxID=1448308 RepID=A0A2T2N714_CORCC|nr:hypothetical protein BS50DRAFT_156352 [Corynespora cassiicola Philippines]
MLLYRPHSSERPSKWTRVDQYQPPQRPMSSSPDSFKLPPAVVCIAGSHCLGFGKKVYSPSKVCIECLKRYDPQQLRAWANNNADALARIEAEVSRKEITKQNIEAHGRFLCAFEDPDYQFCRWRRSDLNLRGTRVTCNVVKRKGTACDKCWKGHLQKIDIVQYFTPTGMCHEEADKVATKSQPADNEGDDDDDDIEGYGTLL